MRRHAPRPYAPFTVVSTGCRSQRGREGWRYWVKSSRRNAEEGMAASTSRSSESRQSENGVITISTSAMSANGRSVMGISQYDPVAKGRPAWDAAVSRSAQKERSKSSKSGCEGQDAQALLSRVAVGWMNAGVRVVGVLAEDSEAEGTYSAGFLRDVASSRRYSVHLDVLPAGTTCHLDAAGMDNACIGLLGQIASSCSANSASWKQRRKAFGRPSWPPSPRASHC